jgi:nucleoside-diphosphate-sugar epimerase
MFEVPKMSVLVGQRILVTGATGLIGGPVAEYLAAHNEVFALARFSDPDARTRLEAAGANAIVADITLLTAQDIPEGLDYVIHAGATTAATSERSRIDTFETNVQATGRLMRMVGPVKGFVYCSSGSVYDYDGPRPLAEDARFGLHNGIPTYSASKIAAESLVEFLSREEQIPTTVIRIFTVYGPAGGTVTSRVDLVERGVTIPLYPGGPNHHSPMYIDDAVEKVEAAAMMASVPPLIVNFGGSETCSVQDYTKMAADILGREVSYRESDSAYYPIWADVTKMHATLGECKVSVADGVRRVIAASEARRATSGIHGIPG